MPPIAKSFGERIADALVEDGLLSAKQVDELLEQQKKEGTRLLKIIVEKSYVTDTDMTVCMGRVLNTPPVNLSRIGIPHEVTELLPRDLAHNYRVVPVSRLDHKLFLAMADPLNVLAIDDVKRITKLEVVPMIASEKAIAEKLNNIDAAKSGSMEDIINDAQRHSDDESDAEKLEVAKETLEEVNLDQLAASSEEAPSIIKLANLILVQATQGPRGRYSPSEHLSQKMSVRLRYRVDGTLVDVTPPPKQIRNWRSPRVSRS